MEILYLVFDTFESPIVKSQVFEMCKSITTSTNIKFKIITVENNIDVNNIENRNGIEIISVKRSCYLLTYFRFLVKVIKNFKNKDTVIHVRSYEPMPIALLLKYIFKTKVIFDMRGMLPEEHIYLNNKTSKDIKYKILKFLEGIFVKKSNEIIVVSNKFKEYLLDKYGIYKNVTVIYCSANEDVKSDKNAISYPLLRKKYNLLENQILIAYVGSFYKYQNIDRVLNYISDINKSTSFKFVIYTKNSKEEVQKLIEPFDIDINSIIIDFIPNDVLVNYLKYFDYGIIIRDNNIINQVASPIKISEYIINDMKVIYSGSIGDFNDLIPKYNSGYDISGSCNDKLSLVKLKPNYTNPSYIKKIVGYEYNSSKYIDVYRRI